jgi:hypothetical protein
MEQNSRASTCLPAFIDLFNKTRMISSDEEEVQMPELGASISKDQPQFEPYFETRSSDEELPKTKSKFRASSGSPVL